MREIRADDFVRVNQDLPENGLHHGDIGVVRSESLAPAITFEVDFHQIGNDHPTTVVLLGQQPVLEEQSLFNHDLQSRGTESEQERILTARLQWTG